MLKIITQAQMVRQPDGSYQTVASEQLNVTADTLARYLLDQLGSGDVEIVEVKTAA